MIKIALYLSLFLASVASAAAEVSNSLDDSKPGIQLSSTENNSFSLGDIDHDDTKVVESNKPGLEALETASASSEYTPEHLLSNRLTTPAIRAPPL